MFKKISNYFVICVVALVGILTLSACSDDNDEKQSDAIVGTWETTHLKGWVKEDGQITESWDEDEESGEEDYYEFWSNGKYIETSRWEVLEGKWTLSNGKLKLCIYDEEDDEYYEDETWNCSVSGNKMTWSSSGKYTDDGFSYEYYEEMTLSRVKN